MTTDQGDHSPHIAFPTGAKILATLGPASSEPAAIGRLIEAGVSIFRLNFSHGTQEEHAQRLNAVRQAAARLDLPIAVLGDLQGPKIRVGRLAEPVMLERGQDVVFVDEGQHFQHDGNDVCLPSGYIGLGREVQSGERVLINDGLVRLLAMDAEPGDPPDSLRARIMVAGEVSSHKGINLPDSDIHAPAITPRDWKWVEWAVHHGLDFLALSFVRQASEVRELKSALSSMCSSDPRIRRAGEASSIPVIAKIEKPQGVENIDAILEHADGIMVARGDLGVELDLAQVPIVQRQLLEKADAWGKPCIVATQMLETMIERTIPTRAEASDVANAIFDGADAVMLSGETAVGRHPDVVAITMRNIVNAAEQDMARLIDEPTPPRVIIESRYQTAALAHGAWHIAHDIDAKLVAVWSQRGGAARYLSQTGFTVPIIAYSSDERQTRRMSLLKRVTALHSDVPDDGSLAEFNRLVDRQLLEREWVKRGDPIVIVAGLPLDKSGAANSVAIHYVGSDSTGFMSL